MNRKMRSKLANAQAKARKESKFFHSDQHECHSCGLPVEKHKEVRVDFEDGRSFDLLLKPSKESMN